MNLNKKKLLLKLLTLIPLHSDDPSVLGLFPGEEAPRDPLALTDWQLYNRYLIGREHFENQDFEMAQSIFYGLTRVRPLEIDYWLALGVTYERLDEPDEACESFGYAASLDFDHPLAHLYQGILLAKRRKWEQALEPLRLAYALGSEEAKPWLGRLQCM